VRLRAHRENGTGRWHMRRLISRLGPWVNFILFCALVAIAAWLVWWQSNRLDAGAVATLIGALLGGAALLLGNGISALDERTRARDAQEKRQAKLKTFITGELVGVAVDLLSGKRILEAAFVQLHSAGGNQRLGGIGVAENFPRDLSLTMSLAAELLVLERDDMEVLISLHTNLEVTRADVKEVAQGYLGILQIGRLVQGLAQDMENLAQCFDRIAPTRKLQFLGSEPELASKILRDAAHHHEGV
jgi:hypothetical protein